MRRRSEGAATIPKRIQTRRDPAQAVNTTGTRHQHAGANGRIQQNFMRISSWRDYYPDQCSMS